MSAIPLPLRLAGLLLLGLVAFKLLGAAAGSLFFALAADPMDLYADRSRL